MVSGPRDPNIGVPYIRSASTWATRPATPTNGKSVYLSDIGGGSTWLYNGTRWRPESGRANLSNLAATSAAIGNSSTVVHRALIPAGLVSIGDTFEMRFSLEKNGTTDAANVTLYLGSLGTTSDAALFTANAFLSAANRSAAAIVGVRVESLTSALVVTNSGAVNSTVSYGNLSNTAVAAAVSMNAGDSFADDNIYLSIAISSNGATNTVALRNAGIALIAGV